MDNAPNLSGVALDELIRDYDGTRLGRQELHGELLLDVEGALWTIEDIENNRVTVMPETLAKIYVAVDPAITSGAEESETGIILSAATGPETFGSYPMRRFGPPPTGGSGE